MHERAIYERDLEDRESSGKAATSNLALIALAIAAFGIGTTEFVIMGLLPEMATDLAVTIPQAGMLISAYALGVTIGGPLLTVATTRLPRKLTLVALMGLFVLGNLGCALAPSYGWLMAARVLTAFCHAAFFGIGAVVAAGLVAPEKRAQAISMMFGGLTLANVLGVPAGTFLGQWAGWRSTFWAVTVIGLFALAAVMRWVPRQTAFQTGGFRRELGALRVPQIWLTLLMSVASSTSMFTLFTYISPVLREVTGILPSHVGGVLLLCGMGLTVGNLLGARLGDWKLMPSLIGSLLIVAAMMALFSLVDTHWIPALTVLFFWAAAVFSATTILQARIVALAHEGASLASTLNIGAFNLGNAIGAGLGGLVIHSGLPLADVSHASALVAVVTIALAAFAAWLEKRATRPVSRANAALRFGTCAE
jgi:DHA1 family inner membrane transport protein